MGKLDNKTVIVTGASRGIGTEIAKALAAEGGKVVCVARTLHPGSHDIANYMKDQGRPGEAMAPFPGSLEETVSQIQEAGGEATALAVDISSEAECERLVKEAHENLWPGRCAGEQRRIGCFPPGPGDAPGELGAIVSNHHPCAVHPEQAGT